MNRLSCLKLALFLLCIVRPCPASQQATGLFFDANDRYRKGEFDAAERTYRRILDAGVDSGPLYFNLGNACFKQKKLGEAIYYWEKALEKTPGDSDIRENLSLASLQIVDRIDVPPDPLPIRLLDRGVHLLTVNQESIVVLALFVLANALFSVYLVSRSARLAFRALVASLALGSIVLLFAGSLAWKIYERDHRRQGIIIEQKVDMRSGPGRENITVVTVHEGIKVRVRGEAAGWYQVSLPNGWNGWVPGESVAHPLMRVLPGL